MVLCLKRNPSLDGRQSFCEHISLRRFRTSYQRLIQCRKPPETMGSCYGQPTNGEFAHYMDDKPEGTECDSCQTHHRHIIPKLLAHWRGREGRSSHGQGLSPERDWGSQSNVLCFLNVLGALRSVLKFFLNIRCRNLVTIILDLKILEQWVEK